MTVRLRAPHVVAALVVVAGSLAVFPGVGHASSLAFTVNTAADTHDATPGDGLCADSTGLCSLRASLEESNAQPAGSTATVTVPAGTYKLILGSLLVTANSIAITGTGLTSPVIQGKGKGAVVNVAKRAQIALTGVELTKGGPSKLGGGGLYNLGTASLTAVAVTANRSSSGGGITNGAGATLILTSSTVAMNSTAGGANSKPGGSGGGIVNSGTLTLTGSTVTANFAGSGGYGLNNSGGAGGSGGGIANSGTVTATGSTISDNFAGSGGPGNNEVPGRGGSGGGVYSSAGTVTLTNTAVSGNTAGGPGASLTGDGFANAGNGGGIWSSGRLILTGSTVSGNNGTAGSAGSNGGGIFTSGTTTIASSTITSNTAGPGYLTASGNGGAIANTGTLTLIDSTLAGNAAGAGEGGVAGGNGGGLYTGAGTATLARDTLTGNTSGAGGDADFIEGGCNLPGPGGNGGGIYSTAAVTITNSTLSGNLTGPGGLYQNPCAGSAPAGVGGGLATGGGTASLSYSTVADNVDGIDDLAGTVSLGGTIVADSTGGPNCIGTISETSGYNLDSGTSCAFAASTDITASEPLLGSLSANGGSTDTQALLPGSPAIDHGGTSATGCPATDQRGMSRPDESADAGSCDMGAYESQGVA